MERISKELNDLFKSQLESEIIVKEITLERENAIKLARNRELFGWFGLAGTTMLATIMYAALNSKNKISVVAITPIIMGGGYFYERLFGNQLEEIKKGAENILLKETQLLKPVGGTVTLHEIDKRIERA
uniref:Plasminogen receptor (KT) n=1 Tax=Parastrongyloides trichosuri TaxID=131310 RepID=A0A0N5A2U1_PARTI